MSSANYHCDFSDISDDELVSATQLIDSVRYLVYNYNRYVGCVNEAAYSSGCWRALLSVSGYYGIYGKHAANGRRYLEYRQVCDFFRVRGLRLLHFWRSFNLLEVMWLRYIKCYFSASKRVRSPTMSGIARDGILYFFILLNGCIT